MVAKGRQMGEASYVKREDKTSKVRKWERLTSKGGM